MIQEVKGSGISVLNLPDPPNPDPLFFHYYRRYYGHTNTQNMPRVGIFIKHYLDRYSLNNLNIIACSILGWE
jgi:hypothetical protein